MHMKVQGHLMQLCFQPALLILFRNHCCLFLQSLLLCSYMYTLQVPAQNCIFIVNASMQVGGGELTFSKGGWVSKLSQEKNYIA